jgi:tetrapyrrole methylase family protein/MazG family protein
MKQTFEEFIELINKSTDRDPWVRDTNIEGYCYNIEIEAKELIEAMKTKDYEHVKEELGDVLMDWAHACKLAEEQGLFTIKDVFNAVNEKIKRRKPYVLDSEKKEITKEEAVRIWKEVKKKEKEQKSQSQKSQTLK